MTPKIYVGNRIDITNSEYDVFIFTPTGSVENDVVEKAKLKFIELYEQSKFRVALPEKPKSIGVSPISARPKRKRIGQ
jgi:hypothetical protein